MTQRQIIEQIKSLQSKNQETVHMTDEERQLHIDRKKRWITFWRKNPNLYIHYVMGITNFPYEHYGLYLMGQASRYTEISTRGTAKTFRAVEYGVSQCLLRPFCQVVVVAVTRGQAQDDYQEKFMNELVYKTSMSPYVSYLYQHGYITTRETEKGYSVKFWNGAQMTFCGCIPSSRGLRANVLVIEECRLIKKSDVDSIAIPMLYPRQPEYKNIDKYKEDRTYDEPEQTIYITSNHYKNEWSNRMYNKTFVNYFKDKFDTNIVFDVDIFLAIKHGLKTPQYYFSQKDGMDELSFRMEILNETVGEVEGAYFTLDMLTKNQVLDEPFYPVTDEQYVNGTRYKFRKKKKDEIRLIFVDFAFAGGDRNDNTCIGCLCGYPKGDSWVKTVPYLETLSGADGDEALLHIREMYFDFDADYIVYDHRNGGSVYYSELTKNFEHPVRPSDEWDSRGFTVLRDMDIQVVSKSVYDDLVERTNDPNAIPCLIPIAASSEFNSIMWQELNKAFRDEQLLLLIDRLEYEQKNEKKSINYSSEQKAYLTIPYIQTGLLMAEAINLTATYKSNGIVSLSEGTNPNNTKDRIVSLGYGNHIMDKLIGKIERSHNYNDTIDWDNIKLVV